MSPSGTSRKSSRFPEYDSFVPDSGLIGQNHLLSAIAQTPHSAREDRSE